MREHEKRYRRGGSGEVKSSKAKVDIGHVKPNKTPTKPANTKITYDDFLESIKDADKIIDINDDSKWNNFLEFTSEYVSWINQKKNKYLPVAKKKLSEFAIKSYQKQPIHRLAIEKWSKTGYRRLKGLNSQFGSKKVLFGGLTSIALLVLGGGFIIFRDSPQPQGTVKAVVDEKPNVVREEPDFPIVTSDTADLEQGLYFDSSKGVATFRDKIKSVPVTVSQQPLNDQQKLNPAGELEKVAVQLSAGISIKTKLGTVYITTPDPEVSKDQAALFMTNDLLIFVKTAGVSISTEGWVEYINSIKL